jgi:hypothetical protein
MTASLGTVNYQTSDAFVYSETNLKIALMEIEV